MHTYQPVVTVSSVPDMASNTMLALSHSSLTISLRLAVLLLPSYRLGYSGLRNSKRFPQIQTWSTESLSFEARCSRERSHFPLWLLGLGCLCHYILSQAVDPACAPFTMSVRSQITSSASTILPLGTSLLEQAGNGTLTHTFLG